MFSAAFVPQYPQSWEEITNTLEFLALGFIMVCIVLWGLAGITQIVGFLFHAADKAQAKKQADAAIVAEAKKVLATQSGAPKPNLSAGGEDSRILAVISAAVFAAMEGAKYRILSVKPAEHDASWAQSGRQSIFSTRNPKK